jgi:hypothetical protein
VHVNSGIYLSIRRRASLLVFTHFQPCLCSLLPLQDWSRCSTSMKKQLGPLSVSPSIKMCFFSLSSSLTSHTILWRSVRPCLARSYHWAKPSSGYIPELDVHGEYEELDEIDCKFCANVVILGDVDVSFVHQLIVQPKIFMENAFYFS